MGLKDKKWFSKWMTFRYRNFKQYYYLTNAIRGLIPNALYRARRKSLLASFNTTADKSYIDDRVNYYCKLNSEFACNSESTRIEDFKIGKKLRTYFFDTFAIVRYFPKHYAFNYVFGDVTEIPPHPAIVKSRPISDDNHHSVILKLNKTRHFTFPNDITPYDKKTDKLVWRGACRTNHSQRFKFLEKWFNHEQCNVAQTSKYSPYVEWREPKLNMYEMLQYKFVMVVEGNDVATSLKWVMASNSVAIMSKPRYETWFMEGSLIPNHHYIEVKEDYSDVMEKMNYYIQHPDKVKAIIRNAHDYVEQFRDEKRERLIALKVMDKYFKWQQAEASSQ
jgi:hypothetical protein